MKQCIKYFMIILLGVLLYDGAAQAAGISCTLISNDSERCFLSQAPTSSHNFPEAARYQIFLRILFLQSLQFDRHDYHLWQI